MTNDSKKIAILKGVLNKIKMQDAGIKEKDMCSPVSSSSKKPYIDYPNLHLNVKQASGLSNYSVNDDIVLVVKGKVVSHSKNERVGSLSKENFNIEIRQIGCEPKKEK